MAENVTEPVVVDIDPEGPVVEQIEVPPKAVSHGWGDMSWLYRRRL